MPEPKYRFRYDDEPDDGQLHTLGLLERLRAETKDAKGAYAVLSEQVDCCSASWRTRTCTTSPT